MTIEANFPDSSSLNPIIFADGKTWPYTTFLKNAIDHPRVEVGEYTYFNDFTKPKNVAGRLIPYLHHKSPEKVKIGKFCQIAHGVQIITSSSMHQFSGISAFPFAIFPEWAKAYTPEFPFYGDNEVGNDVWIGHEAILMPGVKVGSGAIIGTRAVVTKNVAPYSIVAGNPAKQIRTRFDENTVNALLEIAWWDWSIEKITAHIPSIVAGDISALKEI